MIAAIRRTWFACNHQEIASGGEFCFSYPLPDRLVYLHGLKPTFLLNRLNASILSCEGRW